jgi:DNA-3-methyladenine glycosylase I
MSEHQAPRCAWVGDDPHYRVYHDTEWGVPLHDERALFEFLILEGAQAGLSWLTILKKREGYRRAFDNFDAERIARYGHADVARLLGDPGIVRNRLKVAAAIGNARATLAVREEFGGLDAYFWHFVDGAGFPRCGQARRCRTPSARTCKSAASSSWAPRSSMPTCRPPAWSTTTPSTASAMARLEAGRRERHPGQIRQVGSDSAISSVVL